MRIFKIGLLLALAGPLHAGELEVLESFVARVLTVADKEEFVRTGSVAHTMNGSITRSSVLGALKRLGEVGSPQTIDLLVAVESSLRGAPGVHCKDAWGLAVSEVRGLVAIHGRGASAIELRESLLDDTLNPNEGAAVKAICGLGILRDEAAVQDLARFATTGEGRVQSEALRSLGQYQGNEWAGQVVADAAGGGTNASVVATMIRARQGDEDALERSSALRRARSHGGH